MLVLPPRSGRYSWHPPSGRGPMRFQIDDRVKLVFPNGFLESSFVAPPIIQNVGRWSERAPVYSIRDSFAEFFRKRSRKTMSVSRPFHRCLLNYPFPYPFSPFLSLTDIFHLLANIDRFENRVATSITISQSNFDSSPFFEGEGIARVQDNSIVERRFGRRFPSSTES